MGVIDALTKAAGSRAHVLVAEVPGAFRERVALERAFHSMGWCGAESVADADVLAVVGEPGEAFAAVIEHVWAQMSEPRVRLHVRAGSDPAVLLGKARGQLRGGEGWRTGSDIRRGFTPSAEAMAHEHREDDTRGGDADQHEHDLDGGPGDRHADGDHHDRGGGGHDHSAMMPDGIPLAEGAEDRDGLEMDELQLPLGPVLAHWPAGVVLRVTLHGDVVADAAVEQLAASQARSRPDDAIGRAARLLDAACSVLALAGLRTESARARRLRDRCLDGELDGGREVARLGDRVRRQRVLRWVLAGLSAETSQIGSEELHDRLTGLFERARAELDEEPRPHVMQGALALPALVQGMELAAVRLWVAALIPDLAEHELAEAADA